MTDWGVHHLTEEQKEALRSSFQKSIEADMRLGQVISDFVRASTGPDESNAIVLKEKVR